MRSLSKTWLLLAASIAAASPAFAASRKKRSAEELLARFKREPVFWRQLDLAKELGDAGDARVLRGLWPLLKVQDRHLRANAALVFAKLGDPRGLGTLLGILRDRSDRPPGQGIGFGRPSLARQIMADRYYAVTLLGSLKDRRAVDALLPLLDDGDVNYEVAWALGEIGDRRAIPGLIAATRNADALVRVISIQALQQLGATEALPRLRELLNDHAMPSAGDPISVAEAAKEAIAALQKSAKP